MELSFIFYLFATFISVPGTFFLMSIFNKPIAGSIAAFGMLIIFVLFGFQFFNLDGSIKDQSVATVNWPPSINYCPDYLTLFKNGTGTTATLVCIDTVGASKLRDTGLVTTDVNNIVNHTITNTNQKFDLQLSETDDSVRKGLLKDQCIAKKLTWEGMWDGVQELGGMPPRPASAASASS
jgi:hypothetical protein